MRRELFLVIVFIVACDVALRLVGHAFLFSPWAATGNIVLSEKLFWINGRQPDVVVIGDSRAGNGVKPLTIEHTLDEHGIKASAVNIWLPGTGLAEAREIVERLLRTNSTKLVCFALNENQLTVNPLPRGDLKWDEVLLRKWDGYAALEEEVQWQLNRICGALLWGALIKRAAYNAVFDIGRLLFWGQRPLNGSVGKDKGYMHMEGRRRAARIESQIIVEKDRFANYRISEIGLERFKALLSVARSMKLRLVVVIMPVSKDMFAMFSQNGYDSYIRQVQEIATSFDAPLVNYYQHTGLPDSSFYDVQHMNDIGAEAFSRQLTKEVVAPALKDWEGFRSSVGAGALTH